MRSDVSSSTLPGTNAGVFGRYVRQFPHAAERRRYIREMARWILSTMLRDRTAGYVPFALTYSAYCSHATAMRRFTRACEAATRKVFPARSPQEHDQPETAFGVIVLQAVSASGLIHFHGFIRLPRLAVRDADLVPIEIQDRTITVVIDVPRALAVLVARLRDQFRPRPGVSTSLWLGSLPQSNAAESAAGGRSQLPRPLVRHLRYLRDARDGEVRDWTTAEHLPHAVFHAVTSTL